MVIEPENASFVRWCPFPYLYLDDLRHCIVAIEVCLRHNALRFSLDLKVYIELDVAKACQGSLHQ